MARILDPNDISSADTNVADPLDPTKPKKNAGSDYQWDANNVFGNWDLNPLAMEVGGGADGVRDTLSASRDAYLQPLMSKYRSTGKADSTDTTLFNDEGFRNYVRTGQDARPAGGGGQGQTGGNNALLDTLTQQLTQQAQDRAARAAQQGEFSTRIHDSILDRYKTASQPVDPNDPKIAAMRSYHAAEGQRNFNAGREAIASRASASNGGRPTTGALDAQLQSSGENLARDNAGYSANLMYSEDQQRRKEIMDLLQMGSGVLSADESRMLQEELGVIDGNLKSNSLALGWQNSNNQNTQFYDNLNTEGATQAALMNQWIMSQLGQGA